MQVKCEEIMWLQHFPPITAHKTEMECPVTALCMVETFPCQDTGTFLCSQNHCK